MPEQITRLIKSAYGPVLVVLDGEEWGSLPRGVVRKLELAVGDTREPEALRSEAHSVMESCALERGLTLVSSRERSRAEVMRALLRDGYPSGAAHAAVGRLVEIGAVDDSRFASALVRTLAGVRGYGRRRIELELREAGVDDDIASQALLTHASEDDEAARARARAASLARGAGGSVSRLAGRLARRGFSPDVAWRAAREAIAAAGEQDASGDAIHDP